MQPLKGVVLDTRACLYLLKQQVDPEVVIEDGVVSVVTEVELLGYPGITKRDEKLIKDFLAQFDRAEIDEPVKSAAIQLRRKHRLRLGVALICGTALARGATLVSHDKELRRVEELKVVMLPLKK